MAYRYFAVDVGDKRVGLAVSDALGITAQGIETYNRTGDDEKDGEYIRKCAERYAPCRIVFGMPRNMDGSYGFASEKVRAFAAVVLNGWEGEHDFFTIEQHKKVSFLKINAPANGAEACKHKFSHRFPTQVLP